MKIIRTIIQDSQPRLESYKSSIWLDSLGKTLNAYLNGKWEPLGVKNELIYTPITHSQLLELKNSGRLSVGCKYRITDYDTYSTQENTSSMHHLFDIIVTAISENTLDSNAKAAIHAGDTYFFTHSKIEDWELKYDINNDTAKYSWADQDNGRGVIYYMKDEWQNEAFYDFKNIVFHNVYGSEGVYTFNTWNDSFEDGTIYPGLYINNKISTCIGSNNNGIGMVLPFNIFISTSLHEIQSSNITKENCFDNTILNSSLITLCYNCTDNLIQSSYSCILSNGSSDNSIVESNYCDFGNECQYNDITSSSHIHLGNGCANNAIKVSCLSISFGDFCKYNVLSNNSFITYGNNCSGNAFCEGGTTNAFNIENATLEDGVSDCYIDCSYVKKNIVVRSGIHGTPQNKKILEPVYSVIPSLLEFKSTFTVEVEV